ncbi:MAG: GNAT family N-acetyltransferase [Candidatus Thorarchaeota archaeon]
MLKEFPTINHSDLLPIFKKNPFLYIFTKSILLEKSGRVLVDNIDNPQVALLSFKVFEIITGNSESERAIDILKEVNENRLMIVPDKKWVKLVEEKLLVAPYPRTKFSNEKLSLSHVNKLLEKSLPDGFTLQKFDIDTAYNLTPQIAPAFLPFFSSPEAFVNRGIGYCIKENDKVVSAAAAAMPIYDNEFEIQVITDPNKKYRRRGFATIVCAALIKESLENNLQPNWDADNEISVRLALKLGFSEPINYEAYICNRNPLKE